ncbi:Uncharacterized protein Adt_38216 [Abeliophyllum distichum]|uniref:Uncharacterized protein n=1 Tax=Abeliophyllum distichum TaxID=126358 RepID=A0ABD1Q1T1_9LAMI
MFSPPDPSRHRTYHAGPFTPVTGPARITPDPPLESAPRQAAADPAGSARPGAQIQPDLRADPAGSAARSVSADPVCGLAVVVLWFGGGLVVVFSDCPAIVVVVVAVVGTDRRTMAARRFWGEEMTERFGRERGSGERKSKEFDGALFRTSICFTFCYSFTKTIGNNSLWV